MANTQNIKIDTIYVGVYDSSMIVTGSNKQIILIQDKKSVEPKEWYNNFFISSLLVPILVAVITAGFVHYFNRKKYQGEIKKLQEETESLKVGTTKSETEIEKLHVETEKLKRSFQPTIIATLQSVQDKLIVSKIEALKKLIEINTKFTTHDQQYNNEGDATFPKGNKKFKLLFRNFNEDLYEEFIKLHDAYSYLFSDSVLEKMLNLKENFSKLNQSKIDFDLYDGDGNLLPGQYGINLVELIINSIESILLEMRKDCLIDNQFIHKFIEDNK